MLIRQLDALASADVFRAPFWKTFWLDHAHTLARDPERARAEARVLVRTALSDRFDQAQHAGVTPPELLTEVFLSTRAFDAGALRAVLELRDAFPTDRDTKRVLTRIRGELGRVPPGWM